MKSLIIISLILIIAAITSGAKQSVFADSITMTLADNDLAVTVNATKSLPAIHADNSSITIGNASSTQPQPGKFPAQPINIFTGSSNGASSTNSNNKHTAAATTNTSSSPSSIVVGKQQAFKAELNSTGTLKSCKNTGDVGPCWDDIRHNLHE